MPKDLLSWDWNRYMSLFLPVKKTALLGLDSDNSQWELMVSRKPKTSEPDLISKLINIS